VEWCVKNKNQPQNEEKDIKKKEKDFDINS